MTLIDFALIRFQFVFEARTRLEKRKHFQHANMFPNDQPEFPFDVNISVEHTHAISGCAVRRHDVENFVSQVYNTRGVQILYGKV